MPPRKYVKGRVTARLFTADARVSLRADSAAAGKLWSQSQTIAKSLPTLFPMGVKYYTHFVLTGEAAEGTDQEFSGVVEVNQATELRYETKEIEALLARNFDLRSSEVRLINWARLQ
jgi:hypothetical protein